jgi:hypothetical protein
VVKVMVLYERTPQGEAYDEHAALCRAVPGGTFTHGPVFGAPFKQEPAYAYWATWEFADRRTFKEAAATPEFAATGAHAPTLGVPFTVLFAEDAA